MPSCGARLVLVAWRPHAKSAVRVSVFCMRARDAKVPAAVRARLRRFSGFARPLVDGVEVAPAGSLTLSSDLMRDDDDDRLDQWIGDRRVVG